MKVAPDYFPAKIEEKYTYSKNRNIYLVMLTDVTVLAFLLPELLSPELLAVETC